MPACRQTGLMVQETVPGWIPGRGGLMINGRNCLLELFKSYRCKRHSTNRRWLD